MFARSTFRTTGATGTPRVAPAQFLSAAARAWLLVASAGVGAAPGGADPTGGGNAGAGRLTYETLCAGCHEGQAPRAPHRLFLSRLHAGTVVAALGEGGLMAAQGATLSARQRREVATFLTGRDPLLEAAAPEAPVCGPAARRADPRMPAVATGWGRDNSRFIPAAVAGLSARDIPRLQLRWAFAHPNATRARGQPTIAWGAVYAGSQDGRVRAFDLESGCVRWSFRASAEVRTGLVAGEAADAGRDASLYFGDLIGNVYAVDARSGTLRWRVHVDDHPHATLTGTPSLHRGVLYVPVSSLELLSAADAKYECCSFRGAVVALDARTGRMRWRAHPIDKPSFVRTTRAGTRTFAPSGVPIWNSPTVDAARGLLYVGTGESYTEPAADASDSVVAFALRDGLRRWVFQALAGDVFNHGCFGADKSNCPQRPGPDYDIGASVIRLRLPDGAERLYVGQKSGWVFALDPADRGRLVWKTRVGRGGIMGGVHFGMASDGLRLYVPIHDVGHELDLVKHDRPARPGLFALDLATGRELWAAPAADACAGREGCNPGISAAVTALPGTIFAGHSDGMLRAYDSATGAVTWQYDTTRSVRSVSGETAHGGSMGSGGVAIRNGWVVVNSGYTAPAMPGNLMLVFALPQASTTTAAGTPASAREPPP